MKHILFDGGHLEEIKKQLKIKNSINKISFLKEIKMYICCVSNRPSGNTSIK